MGIAENLVLIATDPYQQVIRFNANNRDALLGGAFLLDLAALGRVTVIPSKKGLTRKGKVIVTDHTPVADPLLQQAFDRLRFAGPVAPRDAVGRLGKRAPQAVLARMVATGMLQHTATPRLGGLFGTRHRYAPTDIAVREHLIAGVRAVLLAGYPPDATTGPLIGLLASAGQLGLVIDRSDLKRAKAVATGVSAGDWASEGVREAINATNAALIAVVTATSATTASSS